MAQKIRQLAGKARLIGQRDGGLLLSGERMWWALDEAQLIEGYRNTFHLFTPSLKRYSENPMKEANGTASEVEAVVTTLVGRRKRQKPVHPIETANKASDDDFVKEYLKPR